MVSTRNHPTELPPPATPAASNSSAARTPRAARAANSTPKTSAAAPATSTPAAAAASSSTTTTTTAATATASKRAKSPPAKTPRPKSPLSESTRAAPSASSTTITSSSSASSASSHTRTAWTHTPTRTTLLWLAVSLPLVAWDTGYVLLRPHSMPGGFAHWPVWAPYALYGTVDYVYGWPAWEAHAGFTAAQAALNVVESALYAAYLVWVVRYGVRGAKGAAAAFFAGDVVLKGRWAGRACVVGFAASVMTVAKTVLYWLNEYFSSFSNIGHNTFTQLLFLWIIPNGAWIVLPAYMSYIFGKDIIRGLDAASVEGRKRH